MWTEFVEYAKAGTKLHQRTKPSNDSAVFAGSGGPGLTFFYVTSKHGTRVELYIDRIQAGVNESKSIFDLLEIQKAQIEEIFGEPLEWERLEGKRACRIAKRMKRGGYQDPELYPEIFDATVDAMIRLERALRPFLQKFDLVPFSRSRS